jgi:hypothetical protein
VDRDPRGLVDDDEARVLEEDPQRRVRLGRGRAEGRLELDLDLGPGLHRVARARAPASHPDVPELEGALHRGAAEAERVREGAVEAALGGER